MKTINAGNMERDRGKRRRKSERERERERERKRERRLTTHSKKVASLETRYGVDMA